MKTSTKYALAGILYSARAGIDSALHLLNEDGEVPVSEEPPPCEHPREERLDLSTMGSAERWKCRVCGFKYDAGKEA